MLFFKFCDMKGCHDVCSAGHVYSMGIQLELLLQCTVCILFGYCILFAHHAREFAPGYIYIYIFKQVCSWIPAPIHPQDFFFGIYLSPGAKLEHARNFSLVFDWSTLVVLSSQVPKSSV